jgi:hypothetical protein
MPDVNLPLPRQPESEIADRCPALRLTLRRYIELRFFLGFARLLRSLNLVS